MSPLVHPNFQSRDSFIAKREMPGAASEEEKDVNTTPDICSGVSHITNIYIRDKKSAQLWLKYMLGRWWGLIEQQTHYS